MLFFSSIEPAYYLLPLAGFVVGLFGAMLGGGGGFVFIPILTLGLHIPAQTAVITSLVAVLPICIAGSWGHFNKGNVNFRMGVKFALIGTVGAFLGAGITGIVTARQLQTGFGVYAFLMAINIVATTLGECNKNLQEEKDQLPLSKFLIGIKNGFYALSAGFVTGTFGTSGSAPILAGLFSMKIPVKTAIGTSMIIVLVNTLFAIGAHCFISKIDMTVVALLTAGSLLGAVIGIKLLAKANIERSGSVFKYLYAVAMVVLGLMMIAGKD